MKTTTITLTDMQANMEAYKATLQEVTAQLEEVCKYLDSNAKMEIDVNGYCSEPTNKACYNAHTALKSVESLIEKH